MRPRGGAGHAGPPGGGPASRLWNSTSCLSAANLVVSSAVAPTTLHSSETSRVSWGVTNRGTEAADAAWSDAVYLSKDAALDGADTPLGGPQGALTTLAPGESYTQDAAFTVPAADSGDYYLLFVADSGGDQAESDESDNVRAVPINLVGSSSRLPDLIVTAATAPSTAVIGNIDVSWTVKNQGTADVSGYWSDSFYLLTNATYDASDTFATSYFHSSSLAAGASQSFNTTINLPSVPAGSYYLLVVADGSNYVSESDETNNVRAVPITLTVPAVDLVVTAADAPATAKAGGTATVSWTVKNQGTDAAVASWTDAVYLSTDDKYDPFDTYVTTSYVSNPTPLDPGASYPQPHDHAALGPGRLVLHAVRRRQQPQPGRDRRDEQRPRRPDHAHAPRRRPGGHGGHRARLGEARARGHLVDGDQPGHRSDHRVLDRLRLSVQGSDLRLQRFATSPPSSHFGSEPLGPGETYTIAQTANLPGLAPGDYYLLFLADQYNNVTETNETNNTPGRPDHAHGLECGPGRDRGHRPRDRQGRRDDRHLLDGREPGPRRRHIGLDRCRLSLDRPDARLLRPVPGRLVRLQPAGRGREQHAQHDGHAPHGPGRPVLPALHHRRRRQPGRDGRDQ